MHDPCSVLSHGAVGDGRADDTQAFASAMSGAAARVEYQSRCGYSLPHAVVHVPAGNYLIDRPLMVPSRVDLIGEGDSSRIIIGANDWCPMLVLGVRAPAVHEVDRPKVDWLDYPARGFSTMGDRVLVLPSHAALGHWSDGWDYWSSIGALTIDIAGDFSRVGVGQPVCGLGQNYWTAEARPWALRRSLDREGMWELHMSLGDRPEGSTSNVSIYIDVPPETRRLSIQVDMDEGTVRASVDRLPTANWVRDGTIKPGSRLTPCDSWPLVLGSDGQTAPNDGVRTPLMICGFRIGHRARPGIDQMRDRETYLDPDGSVMVMDFARGMDTAIPVYNSIGLPAPAWGLPRGQTGQGPHRISGLTLDSHGPCMLIGSVLHLDVTDCTLLSHRDSCGVSVPTGISYPVRLTRVKLDAVDSGWRDHCQILTLRDCTVLSYGRDAIRHRGTSVVVDRMFVASQNKPWSVGGIRILPWYGVGSPSVCIRDTLIDCEDHPLPVAVIAQQGRDEPIRLEVDRLAAGIIDGPVVRLDDWPGSHAVASARIGHVTADKCGKILSAGASWGLDGVVGPPRGISLSRGR